MRFDGKRLLILGGKPLGSLDIVQYAKENGAYVIVTDYLDADESPAKKIADESWMVSTADIPTLIKLIKDKNIDGIFSGIHEFNLQKCIELCEILNLPCYTSLDLWHKCSTKSIFKATCRKFGVPVPDDYILNPNTFETDIKKIKYPVIVKPINGSGGRGIVVCYDENKLRECLNNHHPNEFVIEKFYQTGEESTVHYVIQNGSIKLCAVSDRLIRQNQEDVMPTLYGDIYPSKYLANYQKDLDNVVSSMFKCLGLKNGVLFIQGIIENGKYIPYEIGYRLSGGLEYYILEKICGVNTLHLMTNFALTGKMSDENILAKLSPKFDKCIMRLYYSANPGHIAKINGIDKISEIPEVFKIVPIYNEGDTIPESAYGTLNQITLKVFISVPSRLDLKSIISKINSLYEVLDESGKSMLLPKLDPESKTI